MSKKFLAVICILVLVVSLNTMVFAATEVSAPEFTPTIDGKIDALWKNADAIDMSYSSSGNPNYTGKVKAAWDEKYLYLLYDINDGTWSDIGEKQNKDGIEIWIDFKNAKAGNYDVASGSGHLRYTIEQEITADYPGGAESWIEKGAVAKKDGGYVIELALKWQGGITPAVDTLIAFTPSANDDSDLDGARNTYISCNSGSYWEGTTILDTVKLAAAPAAASPAEVSPATGDDYSVVLYSAVVLILAAVMFYLIKRRSFAK